MVARLSVMLSVGGEERGDERVIRFRPLGYSEILREQAGGTGQ